MRASVRDSDVLTECRPYFALILSALGILACVMLFGCQSQAPVDSPPPSQTTPSTDGDATAADRAEPPTTTVAVTRTDPVESPAKVTTLPAPDAAPSEICRLFVQYLANGNRALAEQLLTSAAFHVTNQAELQLQPIGSTAATCHLSPARYATSKKKLCQVVCTIHDQVDGQAVESEITWICRRQKSGWRISGMILPADQEEGIDLLSFENVSDVERIKQALAQEQSAASHTAAAPQETRAQTP